MSDLIENYLTKLQSRLTNKLSQNETQEHISEIRAHLAESCSTLRAEGSSEPEITSLKRLGPEKLLAESLIRARRGFDSMPGWRFVVLPAILLIVYGVLVGAAIIWGQLPKSVHPLVTWLPVAIVVLFLYAMVRSRRLLVAPIMASFALFIVMFTGVEIVWGPFGLSDFATQKRKVTMEGFRTRISGLHRDIELAKSIKPELPFPQELRKGGNYLAPQTSSIQDVHLHFGLIPVNQPVRLTTSLREVRRESQARSDWRKEGAAFLSYTHAQAQEQENLLRIWSDRKAGPQLYSAMLFRSFVWLIPYSVGVLTVGAFLLGLASLRRIIVTATWKPERLAT